MAEHVQSSNEASFEEFSRLSQAQVSLEELLNCANRAVGDMLPTQNNLLICRNKLEEIFIEKFPSSIVIERGRRKSVSRTRNSVGLAFYQPRSFETDRRRVFGAYSHTFLMRAGEIVLISSIEPAATQTHLFKRLCERQGTTISFPRLQLQCSNIWLPLIWMRNRRMIQRRGFIPHDFFTPWNGGLFLGDLQRLEEMSEAAPWIITVSSSGVEQKRLRDPYLEGEKRLLAFTNTFISAEKLKPHQRELQIKLGEYIERHKAVIYYLRQLWMIAADEEFVLRLNPMDVFDFRVPSTEAREAAYKDLEAIVDGAEWQKEAEFSRESRARHKGDALRRAVR